MKEQYPCLHKEICLTVKSTNNRTKEAMVRSISSNKYTFQNKGFGKHENKNLSLRTKPACYYIHGKQKSKWSMKNIKIKVTLSHTMKTHWLNALKPIKRKQKM